MAYNLKQRVNKKYQVMIVLILLTLVIGCKGFNATFQEFIQSKPTSFGIMTVTHARNGVYQYFRKHLNRYANMDCPEMSEISVVWNNDVAPEKVGFTEQQGWKRPVYFIKTPYNSMDFRYMIPEKSRATVYFSIDDDIIITCDQLLKSFKIWREHAVGDIGPLMSYGPRGFDFTTHSENFVYTDPLKAKFYSISLVGVAWVSRFFFEIYNSEKLWEILQMRKIVKQKNNCDDIALNYLVSYFFPELIPVYLSGQVTFETHPAAQGVTKTHYPFRNQCLKEFTQILGYNPLRLVNKQDTLNQKRFDSQAKNFILYLKKKQISERLLQPQGKMKQISIDLINAFQQKIENKVKQKLQDGFSPQKYKESQAKQIEQLKDQLQKARENYNKVSNQRNDAIKQYQQIEKSLTQLQNESDQPSKLEQKKQQISSRQISGVVESINIIRTLSVIMTVFVFLLFIYMVSDCQQLCQESEEGKDPIENENENENEGEDSPQIQS